MDTRSRTPRPGRLAATPGLRTGLAGSLSCITLAAALVACDDPKGILDELLALCGESTVDLSRWWADVSTEQASTIEVDPVSRRTAKAQSDSTRPPA